MDIPKKIDKLLDKREKLALELTDINTELDNWLLSKGANLMDSDIKDSVTTGCMIYAETWTANSNVRKYIENKL